MVILVVWLVLGSVANCINKQEGSFLVSSSFTYFRMRKEEETTKKLAVLAFSTEVSHATRVNTPQLKHVFTVHCFQPNLCEGNSTPLAKRCASQWWSSRASHNNFWEHMLPDPFNLYVHTHSHITMPLPIYNPLHV